MKYYIIQDPTGRNYDDIFDNYEEAEKNLKNAVDNSEIHFFDTETIETEKCGYTNKSHNSKENYTKKEVVYTMPLKTEKDIKKAEKLQRDLYEKYHSVIKYPNGLDEIKIVAIDEIGK